MSRHILRCSLLVLMSMVNGLRIHAQVKGKIVEVSQKADTTVLPGVVVVWNKTAIAATSDADGNFNLPVSNETNRLVISAVGYANDTIAVSDTSKFLLLVLKSGINLN